MQAKIIPFVKTVFTVENKQYIPVILKMIVSLLAAVKKQKKKICFDLIPVTGSLTTLIAGGLIC